MKFRPMVSAVFVAGMAAWPVSADSVTTADNLTVNGRVLQLDKDQVKINSRFSSGSKDIVIDRRQVRTIEFNANTFNAGGPPSIGLRPGVEKSSAATNTAAPAGSDILVLRGGDRRQCAVPTMDDKKVQCGAAEFPRDSVIRLILRGK